MSSSIVTIWSHKEACRRDRFMFAKASSESFFFHCIPPEISPIRVVQGMSRFGNHLGWFTTHLLSLQPAPWEEGRAVVVVAVAAGGSPECVPDHVPPQRHLLELETKRWARAAQRGLN